MNKKASLAKTFLAFALSCVFSAAMGDEDDLCPDEKGPCCDLDWTGQGATIVKKNGDILVSNSPFVPAAVGMRVLNGGRVMALEGSTAVVAYDDGCWHEVKENELLTIEDVSPCCLAAKGTPTPIPTPVTPPPAMSNFGWVPPTAMVVGSIIAVVTDKSDRDRDRDGFVPPPPISR